MKNLGSAFLLFCWYLASNSLIEKWFSFSTFVTINNKNIPSSRLLNSPNLVVAQSCRWEIFIRIFSTWESTWALLLLSVSLFWAITLFIRLYWYSIVCMSRFKLKYFLEQRLSSLSLALSESSRRTTFEFESRISRLFFSFFICIQLLYLSWRSLLSGSEHTQHMWRSGTWLGRNFRQSPCCQHKQTSHWNQGDLHLRRNNRIKRELKSLPESWNQDWSGCHRRNAPHHTDPHSCRSNTSQSNPGPFQHWTTQSGPASYWSPPLVVAFCSPHYWPWCSTCPLFWPLMASALRATFQTWHWVLREWFAPDRMYWMSSYQRSGGISGDTLVETASGMFCHSLRSYTLLVHCWDTYWNDWHLCLVEIRRYISWIIFFRVPLGKRILFGLLILFDL